MPVRTTSSNYPDYPHLSSPALVAKLLVGKSRSREGTQRRLFSEEETELPRVVFGERSPKEEEETFSSSKEDLHESVEVLDYSGRCLPEKLNESVDIDEIFMKYFEPCIEEMCSIRDDCLSQNQDKRDRSVKNKDFLMEEDYIRSESSDSAVEIMTEEEELLYDPGRYFTDMINEVFGQNVRSSLRDTKESNFERGLHPDPLAGESIVSVPLIPLLSSPPLLSLSAVKSKVSKFESFIQQDSSSSGTKGSVVPCPRTQLWFHKDGIRSSNKEEEEEPEGISSPLSAFSPLEPSSTERKPPMHPKSPISPRRRSLKNETKEEQPKKSVTESNRILRNSLGKMEPSERIKLEEILDMCVEYERQIESQMENKETSWTSASLIPLQSPPNGSTPQPTGIKTNGSLPREKRHASSPSKETENNVIFNFDGVVTKVHNNNEDGGGGGSSLLIPPSSPRTRIRTYLGGPSSPPEADSAGLEDNCSSSPISRKPPRSKHDTGPASPRKESSEDYASALVASGSLPPLPSQEAPSRLLIGMTMLNHKHHAPNLFHHRNSNNNGVGPYSEFDNSSRMVETLKSQRHTQILILSAVKRQLSDLESEAAEGLKELELERSLILGEREAEASELEKLRLRVSQLKTQEARLSGVFQELQKSLSRKTDSAKRKILEAEEEIERLEDTLHELERGVGGFGREEETHLLLHLKEQHEILDNETKAFEDLEFHQMEEETSKETEREELLKEISDAESLVVEKARRLEEIDSQRQKILINARNDTQSLLAQRQKLLCDLDREKIKLSSIERRLSSFLLPDAEEDPDTLISTSSSVEEDDMEMGVTGPWQNNSELDHALKRLDLFGEESADSGYQQKKALLESGHSTTVEEEDSEDEGIRISIASSSYQESNGRLRNSKPGKIKNFSNMDGVEYLSHSSSESSTKSLSTTKNSSVFKAGSGRPVSDESSYWDEQDPSSVEVRRRGNKSQQTQRPLTRYLPIRNEGFDLRVHIESAGHPIDSNPSVSRHILLNSSSCRGHLYKMSSKFRKWNRRWFVFDRNKRTLIYYSDKTETKAKGGIYFESIEDVYVDHLNSLKSPRQKETFLMKTRDRLYCLMAPSIETMRIWIDVIFTGAEGFQGYHK